MLDRVHEQAVHHHHQTINIYRCTASIIFARVYLRIGSKNCLSYTTHLLTYAFIPNTPSTLLCSYCKPDSSNDLSSQPINGHYQNRHTIIDMSKFRLIADGTGYNPRRRYHHNNFSRKLLSKGRPLP